MLHKERGNTHQATHKSKVQRLKNRSVQSKNVQPKSFMCAKTPTPVGIHLLHEQKPTGVSSLLLHVLGPTISPSIHGSLSFSTPPQLQPLSPFTSVSASPRHHHNSKPWDCVCILAATNDLRRRLDVFVLAHHRTSWLLRLSRL